MTILRLPLAALAWLGRQGTSALAVSVFLGLALPQYAAYVKPYLGQTVFVLLIFSYLRTDPDALRGVVRAPGLAIVATLWVMIALPALLGGIYIAANTREHLPDLHTMLILQAAIAPITSSAAFAALMGLNVALSLVGLILCNLVSPVTTVAFSTLFLGTAVISPLELGGKLLIFFVASGLVAHAIRRAAGKARIEKHKEVIDGLNVIAAFVFAVAAMETVPRYVLADPLLALGVLGLVLVVALGQIALTMLVFWRTGLNHSLVIAMLAGLRNQGVIMAAIGSTMTDLAWLYFAMAQFPVYMLPAILKPLAKRLPKQPPAG